MDDTISTEKANDTIRVVNFEGLNFCSLEAKMILWFIFCGIHSNCFNTIYIYIQFSGFSWIRRYTQSNKFEAHEK